MELLRQHIKPGDVYRRSDLEYFSTAIDRHLSQLVQEGTLLRLSQGLYHAPQFSKFGAVSHCDDVLVECFLKDDEFLMGECIEFSNFFVELLCFSKIIFSSDKY